MRDNCKYCKMFRELDEEGVCDYCQFRSQSFNFIDFYEDPPSPNDVKQDLYTYHKELEE